MGAGMGRSVTMDHQRSPENTRNITPKPDADLITYDKQEPLLVESPKKAKIKTPTKEEVQAAV